MEKYGVDQRSEMEKIAKQKEIKSKILDKNIKKIFKSNTIGINSYQGSSEGAAIVFFRKLN